jgi:hypothetical protein
MSVEEGESGEDLSRGSRLGGGDGR